MRDRRINVRTRDVIEVGNVLWIFGGEETLIWCGVVVRLGEVLEVEKERVYWS